MEYIVERMVSFKPDIAFYQFTQFIWYMCYPDGIDYHSRMNDDNGKTLIESHCRIIGTMFKYEPCIE
jgi:hypothetical protein